MHQCPREAPEALPTCTREPAVPHCSAHPVHEIVSMVIAWASMWYMEPPSNRRFVCRGRSHTTS
jgi:hypothetical protein